MGSRANWKWPSGLVLLVLLAVAVWLEDDAGPAPVEDVQPLAAPVESAEVVLPSPDVPAVPTPLNFEVADAAADAAAADAAIDEPRGPDRLEVLVTDVEGAAVAGAWVQRLDERGGVERLGVTDDAGSLVLSRAGVVDPLTDAARVLITHTQHAAARRPVQPGKRRVRARLSPGYSLRVFVRSASGGPLVGADVSAAITRANSRTDMRVDAGVTDDEGAYTLVGLPAGRVALAVQAAGHHGVRHDMIVGAESDDHAFIELSRGQRLDVIVFDEKDEPVPGVRLFGYDFATGRGQHVTTDEEGRALLDQLPPSPANVALTAAHDRYVGFSMRHVTSEELNAGRPLVLRVTLGASLRVVFADAPADGSCADVEVSLHAEARLPSFGVHRVAEVESRGLQPLELHALPTDKDVTVVLSVSGRRFVRETLRLEAGETHELLASLPPMVGASIVVLRAGVPQQTGTLSLMASDGRRMPAPGPGEVPVAFQLLASTGEVCVEPGRYDVIYRDQGTTATRHDQLIESGTELRLELGDEWLTGRLVDGAGQPLANEVLMLTSVGRQRASSGVDGRFQLRGHEAEQASLSLLDGIAGEVKVLDDVPSSGDLGDLVLQRFAVRGTVRDVSTGVGMQARLFVQRGRGFGHIEGDEVVPVSADGHFELALPAGAWKLSAWQQDWRSVVQAVELGADSVTQRVDVWMYEPAALVFVAPDLPEATFDVTVEVALPDSPWAASFSFDPDAERSPWDVSGSDPGTRRLVCPPGRVTITVEREGVAPQTLVRQVVSGQDLIVDVSES